MVYYYFVFIYGGCYGVWVWCKLEDCFQRKGCKVIVLDMIGVGIYFVDFDFIIMYEEYY